MVVSWRWVTTVERLGETDDEWLYSSLDPQNPVEMISLRKAAVGMQAPERVILLLENAETYRPPQR